MQKCLVDDKGRYNHLAPEFLRNKCVQKEGNDLVLDYIEKDVVHLGQLLHSCPIDWRTKEPVIMSASHQWFINTDRLKKAAIEQIERTEFYPTAIDDNGNKNRKQLISRVQSRPYWCISRQRAWGTPIPVFYRKSSGEAIVHKSIIDNLCAEIEKTGNIDFWWMKSVAEIIPAKVLAELNLCADDIEKGNVGIDLAGVFVWQKSCHRIFAGHSGHLVRFGYFMVVRT